MSAAVTRVWAIQEIANPRRARDASRMTMFGAVSIVGSMAIRFLVSDSRNRSLYPDSGITIPGCGFFFGVARRALGNSGHVFPGKSKGRHIIGTTDPLRAMARGFAYV